MKNRAIIENCKVTQGCSQDWDSMKKEGVNDVRFCSECKQEVHWCNTKEEIQHAAEKQWCVAYSRLIDDLGLEGGDYELPWIGLPSPK